MLFNSQKNIILKCMQDRTLFKVKIRYKLRNIRFNRLSLNNIQQILSIFAHNLKQFVVKNCYQFIGTDTSYYHILVIFRLYYSGFMFLGVIFYDLVTTMMTSYSNELTSQSHELLCFCKAFALMSTTSKFHNLSVNKTRVVKS